MQERVKAKAIALLESGACDRVLGWKAGAFFYDVTPAVFTSREEIEKTFVFGPFCGANLSKYLIAESRKGGKVGAFLKPCDTYSFQQLQKEHRIRRENVYAVGVPCAGMCDMEALRAAGLKGVTGAEEQGDSLLVHTLYGDQTVVREQALAERCRVCKSKKMLGCDELLGEQGEEQDSARFDQVAALEAMTPDERFAFWQKELSRCIRCNACRNVCPACSCEKCVFDNPNSGAENKAPANSFEENLFHIIRAFHVAGRCTDCGECSRVCPQHIPLHLLNRKFIKDINELYGPYQAGADMEERPPLVNFQPDDPEPSVVKERGEQSVKKLPVSQLNELFAAIAAAQKLYIPAGDAKTAAFTPWQEGLTLTSALNTNRSAKDLFFPQVENLVDFKVSGKQIEVIESRDPAEPFVLFGVRACDCRSFDILDKVFLCDPADTYYQTRREHGTVVTLACTEPEETCFCTALGIDPTNPAGDVSGWIAEETLYLRANTEKGEALLASLPMLEEGEKPEQDASIFDRLPLKDLKLDAFGGDRMMEHFRSEKWAALAESCLGCGTCTFVCPTCQCYDIKDFKTNDGVKRFRCWDSCMYSDFTLMSAGQPRPTQLERFRQRFMHKLVYYPANHDGEFGCVGCGRCLQKCPISMNIVKVALALGEEDPS